MATTPKQHMNMNDLGSGQVASIAAWSNDLLAKIAPESPTLLLSAGESLVFGDPYYVKAADGKAWKATDSTECHGVWLSVSTSANAQGFGQRAGIMTGDSWTWTPGAALYVNSGALSHTSAGAYVGYAISATQIDIAPRIAEGSGGAATTYFGWLPQYPPVSPHANDEPFDTAGALPASLTEWDAGSILTTPTVTDYGLKMVAANASGSKLAGVHKNIPSGDWTMDAYVSLNGQLVNSAGTGIMLGEDLSAAPSTGKILLHGLWYRGNSTDYIYYGTSYYTNYTSFSATWRWIANFTLSGCFLRVVKNGTTYYFLISTDGIGWFLFYTQASMPFTTVKCGIWVHDEGNGGDVTSICQFMRFRASTDLYLPVYGRRM